MGIRPITVQESAIRRAQRIAADQKKDKRKPGESMADTEYKIDKRRPKTKRKNILEKKYFKTTKRPMGGKVYKVDNSGQQMVAKQYGGKIHG
jgi:hypothetical protein